MNEFEREDMTTTDRFILVGLWLLSTTLSVAAVVLSVNKVMEWLT